MSLNVSDFRKAEKAIEYVVAFSEVQCDCGDNEAYLINPTKTYGTGQEITMMNFDTVPDVNFSPTFGACEAKYRSSDECEREFLPEWFAPNENISVGEMPSTGECQEYYDLVCPKKGTLTSEEQALVNAFESKLDSINTDMIHPLIFISKLICKKGGVISVTHIGQRFSDDFICTPQFRRLIEAIKQTDLSRNEQNDLIIQAYEKYLYLKHKDSFDEYNKVRGEIDRERAPKKEGEKWKPMSEYHHILDPAEQRLAEQLQSSDTDIMAVAKMMADDVISNSPRAGRDFSDDLWDFLNLVETGSAPDVKGRNLNDAIGASNYNHAYSIWSRGWFPQYDYNQYPDTKEGREDARADRNDYLGNYLFGYVGMGYWEGFDSDFANRSMTNSNKYPSDSDIVENAYLLLGPRAPELFGEQRKQVETMALLAWGGGLAQVRLDLKNGNKIKQAKTIWNYAKARNRGDVNAGENEGDTEKAMEGAVDYYNQRFEENVCDICGKNH